MNPPLALRPPPLQHEHEGGHYWHNTQTGVNTWDLPEHESWVVHDDDL